MRIWLVVLAAACATPAAGQVYTNDNIDCRGCGAGVVASREEAARILAESPSLSNRTRPPGTPPHPAGPAVILLKSRPTSGPFGDLAGPAGVPQRSAPSRARPGGTLRFALPAEEGSAEHHADAATTDAAGAAGRRGSPRGAAGTSSAGAGSRPSGRIAPSAIPKAGTGGAP